MDWTSIIIATIPVVGAILTTILTARDTKKEVKKVSDAQKLMTAAQLDLMRNEITKLYYRRQNVRQLYQYERESLDKMYAGYHGEGGNSFVDDIYTEMRRWMVLPAGIKIAEERSSNEQ